MLNIEFLPFSQINPEELCAVLNQAAIRTHLIEHPYFDEKNIQAWMLEKQNIDKHSGCRIRAVMIDDTLAGWCGIQPDDSGFELAIVIKTYWGRESPYSKPSCYGRRNWDISRSCFTC